MPAETSPLRLTGRLLGVAAAGWLAQISAAAAFPISDPTNPSVVPTGSDLSVPDQRDLQHQMQLLSGFASAGAGWTFLPRVSVEEEYTDNILQVQTPRRWDLSTIVAPGIAVLGDTGRVQLRLNYEPTLDMHLRTGSQNALTQQLNATGLVTIVPDLLFVDVRALAGVQATTGGIGGLGGLGQSGAGPVTAATLAPSNDLGLSKENKTQTSSFSLSPYVLYHFNDLGDGKVGASFNRSSSSQVTGFAPLPFVANGLSAEQQSSVEETARFQTGDRFGALQDTATADGTQTTFSGASKGGSTRDNASNRVDYAINHTISVYASLGWEYIVYSGSNNLRIDDPTWSVGTTLAPDPDSTITIGYGHQSGRNSLTFNGRYALTARTILTASYTNGIGTQLEQVRDQLDEGSVGNNGNLVNSQTGGPLLQSNNALGVETGVFTYTTLTIGASTVLDRDTFRLTLGTSEQSQVASGQPSSTNTVRTLGLTWSRQFTPDLGLNASAYYSLGTPSAITGSTRSLAASVALQYTLTETLSAFARYSYYDRQASAAGQSMYQDLLLIGITKQF